MRDFHECEEHKKTYVRFKHGLLPTGFNIRFPSY